MGPGKQLAALREARGWTQIELARRSGVGQATISRLEADPATGATTHVINRLAAALAVAPSQLLRTEEEDSGQPAPAPRYDFWDAQREIPPDAPEEARHAFAQLVKDQARLFFRSGGLHRHSRHGDGAGEKNGATALADDPNDDGCFKTDSDTRSASQIFPLSARGTGRFNRQAIAVPA